MSNLKNIKQAKHGAFSDYVKRKEAHQKATYRIYPNGNTRYLLNGNEYTKKEFNDMFPIGIFSRSKHGHIGATQIILNTH